MTLMLDGNPIVGSFLSKCPFSFRYLIVGSSLLFTMIVFTLGTQAKSLLLMTLQAIRRAFDQRTGHLLDADGRLELIKESVTHCSTQEELEQLYIGTEVINPSD